MNRDWIASERLRSFWQLVDEGKRSPEQYEVEKEQLLKDYREQWSKALVLAGFNDLEDSTIQELGEYFAVGDLEGLRRRCEGSQAEFGRGWDREVVPGERDSIEGFYHRNEVYVYALAWWHTLVDDASPLAYVSALRFAQRHGCVRSLDFGSGTGSGALIFAQNGFQTSIADISAPLLDYSSWRFRKRQIPLRRFDLRSDPLPTADFDIITAMDVFEHLADPVRTVELLAAALAPSGIIYGRFNVEEDDGRGQHIVRDFTPTFQAFESLGFQQIWEDDWLWGHKAYQRTSQATRTL